MGKQGTVLGGDASTERRDERVAGKAGDSPSESHRALRSDSPRFAPVPVLRTCTCAPRGNPAV